MSWSWRGINFASCDGYSDMDNVLTTIKQRLQRIGGVYSENTLFISETQGVSQWEISKLPCIGEHCRDETNVLRRKRNVSSLWAMDLQRTEGNLRYGEVISPIISNVSTQNKTMLTANLRRQ